MRRREPVSQAAATRIFVFALVAMQLVGCNDEPTPSGKASYRFDDSSLVQAVYYQDEDTLRRLIGAGVDIDAPDRYGDIALKYAVCRGDYRMTSLAH